MMKDFATCPHCEAKGNLDSMMPLSLETEIVSRSDGKSFHLFLLLRPQPRHAPSGGIIASEMVALFRYAHDSLELESEPVDVTLEGLMGTTREQVNQQVQEVADLLVGILQSSRKLERRYRFRNSRMVPE